VLSGPLEQAEAGSSSSTQSGGSSSGELTVVDADGGWQRLLSGGQGHAPTAAALLVRPDGHVAWRKLQQQQASASVCAEQLRGVLGAMEWRPQA